MGGFISVSARSLGEVNVQVIMEKLGGGGHLSLIHIFQFLSPPQQLQHLLAVVQAHAFFSRFLAVQQFSDRDAQFCAQVFYDAVIRHSSAGLPF